MPKKFIKRYMPAPETIRDHKSLRVFGSLLHDPNLFHLNRRSIAGAFAIGLFFAWMPVPFQMILAAAAAIYFGANLAISVALVWTSNPFTMPPLFYFAYRFGSWMLGIPETDFHFELSLEWLGTGLHAIWQPFLLGCLVLAASHSLVGYFGIRLIWRINILSRLKKKRLQRNK